MFTGSTKLPPAKTPQPERLDEVYAALRRGLQSYLQVHQLELDSLGQQIRENKRNGRLVRAHVVKPVTPVLTVVQCHLQCSGSLYEQDKQVKAIERFMRRLEFHLSKHMCSLESELESQMGEFHVKMKGESPSTLTTSYLLHSVILQFSFSLSILDVSGLAGFARLCAGDQYEVLMRYGRQRWRLRGRVEVSNKQIWDSEEYIFLPLVTELLSIKVTELKSLANHVVVGSVSCEMLDLFCPLPQTLAVDINDLGTVKLNLEVTWSPFDKDDQTSSTSTVSKRLLSNQSPPDTPSMREQVFYSLLKRQGEMENGTVWSNSSESSDDSSSPALAHHAQRLTASNLLQTTLTTPLSFTPHKSSASTPSLSSNQEEDETEAGEVFSQTDVVPNGHLLQTSCSHSHTGESSPDCTVTDRASVQSADLSETSADLSCSCPDVSSVPPVSLVEEPELCVSTAPKVCVSAEEVKDDASEDSSDQAKAEAEDSTTEAGHQGEETHQSIQEPKQLEGAPTMTRRKRKMSNQKMSNNKKTKERRRRQEDDRQHEENQNKMEEEKVEEEDEEEKDEKNFYSGGSDEEDAGGLEILMEAPEGFRNSDEDRFSESQESSVEDLQDLGQIEMPEDQEEHSEEKGDEPQGTGDS
ncbi:Rho family-interacting cell polarization regulator 1 [Collichthys lucidus]|uniref:Rho family-interacting cell polarization regulator 1 n=1 Tax=Collichthys lucidus TaxID=240159 RepID=A0A4U5U764_COLLU|nr:Rho family-interacting cell polarization regulator 1 [Collichthys lucidus]